MGKKFDVSAVVQNNTHPSKRVGQGDLGPGRDMPQSAKTISLARIRPSPFQPRLRIDPEKLEFLAASIKTAGQETPIAVRMVEIDGETYYELIDGHRRVEAHRIIGLEDIKATIRILSDAEAAIAAYSATAVHEGFSDYESGKALLKLLEREFVRSKSELAKIAGVGRGDFYRFLSLASLPPRFCVVLDEYPDLIQGTGGEHLKRIITDGYEELAYSALIAVRDGILKESNIPHWYANKKEAQSKKSPSEAGKPKKIMVRHDGLLKASMKENKHGGFDLSIHPLHASVTKEVLEKALTQALHSIAMGQG